MDAGGAADQGVERGLPRPTRYRRTLLPIGLGIRACQADHRARSPPPPSGSPDQPQPITPAAYETRSPTRLLVDEVGYIPFEPGPDCAAVDTAHRPVATLTVNVRNLTNTSSGAGQSRCTVIDRRPQP